MDQPLNFFPRKNFRQSLVPFEARQLQIVYRPIQCHGVEEPNRRIVHVDCTCADLSLADQVNQIGPRGTLVKFTPFLVTSFQKEFHAPDINIQRVLRHAPHLHIQRHSGEHLMIGFHEKKPPVV